MKNIILIILKKKLTDFFKLNYLILNIKFFFMKNITKLL